MKSAGQWLHFTLIFSFFASLSETFSEKCSQMSEFLPTGRAHVGLVAWEAASSSPSGTGAGAGAAAEVDGDGDAVAMITSFARSIVHHWPCKIHMRHFPQYKSQLCLPEDWHGNAKKRKRNIRLFRLPANFATPARE